MEEVISGDFVGFTFNGVHSSTLGIIRTSDGSRYSEDLLPNYQDKVVDAPGTDETYYFGTFYKQKLIPVSFAFDNMSESQIRRLKILLSDKQVHELWFDETPYKAYNVKINGTPTLKYICFNIEDEFARPTRVYKGEGTINFVAYYPFAHSRFKYLDEYDDSYTNKTEWATSSGLKIKSNLDDVIQLEPGYRTINLWNGGDLKSDFSIYIYFNNSNYITAGKFSIDSKTLKINRIYKKGSDSGIQINTRLKLIQGFKENKGKISLTNNIYNEYIISGDFFKIPLKSSQMNLYGLYGDGDKLILDYKYWYL